MCEPFHSIVQFPDSDDKGPTGPRLDAATKSKNWLVEQGKKILNWFHFSKMGSGHSGATGFGMGVYYLPRATNYEAHWWDRKLTIDGRFNGEHIFAQEALDCAKEYANRTSIGSLSTLRRFLETSMKQTTYHEAYVDRFIANMLNSEGKEAFYSKAKKVLGMSLSGHSRYDFFRTVQRDPVKRDRLIKLMMGYTRKRELLVPEWADDTSLWLPSGQ